MSAHSRFCSLGKLSPEDGMPLPCDCGAARKSLNEWIKTQALGGPQKEESKP